MSKKHGARKKRRKRARAKRRDNTPRALLENVAAALNACEKAGARVRLLDVGVLTDYGAVIPFKHGWAARPFGD